ncbi:MAG: Rieske (2Fe-2S) protein [Planctomycetota bacterium]
MPQPHRLFPVRDLPIGQRKIVEIDGKSIGVFNIDGRFHAIRNACPHQQAPLCEGQVSGTTLPSAPGEFKYGREGEIIRCPWHGWEFDLTTGRSVFNPQRCRVRCFRVDVDVDQPALESEEEPSVETFEVREQDAWVVLYV